MKIIRKMVFGGEKMKFTSIKNKFLAVLIPIFVVSFLAMALISYYFLQNHFNIGSRYGFLFLINCSTSFYNEP